MQPIINVLEEDRATDIDNMHKKFGKDCACGSAQTDRYSERQTYSARYFATAPVGEAIVIANMMLVFAVCHKSCGLW